jgi:hypothetical protein
MPIGCGSESDARIQDLTTLKNLSALDLAYTVLTDEGIKDLATLKNLNALDLSGTKVTEVGVKELQQALPKCRIVKHSFP